MGVADERRLCVLAFAVFLATGGCGSSPAGNSTASAETFAGTLRGGSNAIHLFTVTKRETVSVTVTQANVPAGIQLALGLGTPVANGACLNITSANPPVQPGSQPQVTMSATAGSYCIELVLFQIGQLGMAVSAPASVTATYSVTVTHM